MTKHTFTYGATNGAQHEHHSFGAVMPRSFSDSLSTELGAIVVSEPISDAARAAFIAAYREA